MARLKANMLSENKYSIKCPYEMVPEYVTVHNTANDASAANEVAYMISNNNEVSFHYAVDDKEIVQGVPENRNTWNAGDGNGPGNRKSISVEICYSKSGGDRFIQAEKNAAEFVARILKQHGWGIDRVKKHQDWTGKYCPHRTLDMGWDRFLNMVKSHMDGNTQPSVPQTPSKPSGSTPTNQTVHAYYRVRTQKHGWLPEVTDLSDYAGWEDSSITDVAIRVSDGSVKYRVHTGGRWLPYVTGCNIHDDQNGYAGIHAPIDAIEVYYYTPDSIRPYKRAKYRVAPVGGSYYPYQYDNEIGNGQDGYAGDLKNKIGKFQLCIE